VVHESSTVRVLNFLGVFYEEEGHTFISDENEGTRHLTTELSELDGSFVRFLAHHKPPDPPELGSRGGGSCYIPNGTECPFGHHKNPDSLYVFDESGILRVSKGRVSVTREDTKVVCLRTEFLWGHRAQLVITNIPSELPKVPHFDLSDPSSLSSSALHDLSKEITSLRDFLKDVKGGIDGI